MDFEWVQCDKCQKWRGLKPEDFSRVVQKETWSHISKTNAVWRQCLCRYCFQNPDTTQASCDIPQMLTDSEIDAIYKKREIAKAKKLTHPVIWQEIHGNVYTYKRRKSWKEDDIAICQCQPIAGQGCLDNCINRMLNIECTQGFCPCGAVCTNQRFTRRQHATVEINRAGLKGFGLFCVDAIREGDFVTEYMGEVVDEAEYIRRRTFYAEKGHKHYYFMQIGNGEVIDACRMGNAGRFMNHSCDPNCETQKWVVKGDLRVGFFALRNIKAGEELTFNYNFQTEKPIRCCCGQSKCRGTIGGQKLVGAACREQASNDNGKETTEWPDPIMLKEDEVDDVVKVILARQVGLKDESGTTVDQIRIRLRDLYWKHGRDKLADSLDVESTTDSGIKTVVTRDTSSGDSSERHPSGPSRLSVRKRGRGRGRATTGSAFDRRGKIGITRQRSDPERRRSEVDSSLDDITAASGRLFNPSRRNVLKVLRLFNLIEIGMNEKERHEAELAKEREQRNREELERSGQLYLGTAGRSQPRQQPVTVAGYCINEITTDDGPPTARQRAQFADLSLLLDVVQHTIDPVARGLFIECGILSQVQQVIGRNFGPQYSVMLRKILRVVDCLPLKTSDFKKTRSAHGTMEDLIVALSHHKDNGVRNIALSLARQHSLESEPQQIQKESEEPPCHLSSQSSVDSRSTAFTCEPPRPQRSRPTGFSKDPEEFQRTRPISHSRSSFDHPLPPVYSHDHLSGPFYPPPPPPPPAVSEKTRVDADRLGSEASGSISLPPGFGYLKSCAHRDRDPDLDARRSHRIPFSDSHHRGALHHGAQPGHLTLRKKQIQQRIIKKLHKPNPSQQGLFLDELGKVDHLSQLAREEILAKEARDLEEERHKRQRLMSQGENSYAELEGWDHLNRDFEDFVRQILRQRIQKYQQPEHPLKLSASEADSLFKKLYASIIESEENAFKAFARDRVQRHVSKVKLALNIKEFTSKSMHNYYDTKAHQS